MNDLKLIKPVHGQVNWGNAINHNFELLYQKINTSIIETQGLKDRVEEIDTLYVQNDKFIYIDASGNAKICNLLKTKTNANDPDEIDPDKWKDPQGDDFDPTDVSYTAYQGWFVKVNGNSAVSYSGYKWLTGDILIIHKQSATMTANSQSSVVIEQWSSVMGGYFTPAEIPEYNATDKKVERKYNKVPSIVYNGTTSIEIEEPSIYWRPESYSNGKLAYKPYIKIGSNIQEYKALETHEVEIEYTTKGNGNYFTLSSSQNTITISNVFNNYTTTDMENTVIAEPEFEMVTSHGTMKIKLYNLTPKHRDNFVKLVKENYYDGLRFHRVIEGFMIQGGDPYSRDTTKANLWGQGGPDYTVPAEFVSQYWHKKGAIAAARKGDMANPTKASSGSQFYIVHDENACLHLDGQYSIFGEVTEGLDVIDRIATVPTDYYDRPLEDVMIISVKPLNTEAE